MNREKQLIKNTFILAVGKICTQFINFFLLPLYTTYLTAKEYGIVDLLNNYISLIIPIAFFQMDQGVFRFLIDARNNEQKTSQIISTSLITVTLQAIIFTIIYLIIGFFIQNEYKYFLMMNTIIFMYSNFLLQICRGLGDNVNYSIGSLITGLFTIVLNILFIVIFNLGAYGMLLSSLISNAVCIIYIFFHGRIYKFVKIDNCDFQSEKAILKYSFPLVPNQLSWWVVNVSDRTIITYFISIAANGVYSAANKFSTICITLFNIFNMTWSESASLHIKDGDSSEFFSKILNKCIKVFFSFSICIISVMPFCFKYLITGAEYAEAYYQIPILLIATIFNIIVAMIGSIYVALKKSGKIARTSIFSAIINIVINLIFISKIGLYAASLSTLIAYFVMTVYRIIDVQKYVKVTIDKRNCIIYILVLLIILISYYSNKIYLLFISLFISACTSIYLNFDILKKVSFKLLKL